MIAKLRDRFGFMLRCATVLTGALLLLSVSAEASWLGRSIGVGGVYHSVKKNMGEVTDHLYEISSAAMDGDGKRVQEIWQEVKKTPGKIIKEAFPVLKAGDAAVAAKERAQKRLQSARQKIDRFVGSGDSGVSDARVALAVGKSERTDYESSTGILIQEPLPSLAASGPSAEEVAGVIAFARNCWNHQVGRYSHDYDQFKVMMERRRQIGASMDCVEGRLDSKGQEEGSRVETVGAEEDSPVEGNTPADPWDDETESGDENVRAAVAPNEGDQETDPWADELDGGDEDLWATSDDEDQRGDQAEEGSIRDTVSDSEGPAADDSYQTALLDLEQAEAERRHTEEAEQQLAKQRREDEEKRQRHAALQQQEREEQAKREAENARVKKAEVTQRDTQSKQHNVQSDTKPTEQSCTIWARDRVGIWSGSCVSGLASGQGTAKMASKCGAWQARICSHPYTTTYEGGAKHGFAQGNGKVTDIVANRRTVWEGDYFAGMLRSGSMCTSSGGCEDVSVHENSDYLVSLMASDSPPACKFVHRHETAMYWAGPCIDGLASGEGVAVSSHWIFWGEAREGRAHGIADIIRYIPAPPGRSPELMDFVSWLGNTWKNGAPADVEDCWGPMKRFPDYYGGYYEPC